MKGGGIEVQRNLLGYIYIHIVEPGPQICYRKLIQFFEYGEFRIFVKNKNNLFHKIKYKTFLSQLYASYFNFVIFVT